MGHDLKADLQLAELILESHVSLICPVAENWQLPPEGNGVGVGSWLVSGLGVNLSNPGSLTDG